MLEVSDSGPRIYTDLMWNTGLESNYIVVLSIIIYYYNKTDKSEQFKEIKDWHIKRYLQMSNQTIQKIINQLEQWGYIEIDHNMTTKKNTRFIKPLVTVK